MSPFKSLGPNGYATTFYQYLREIVGKQVCKTILKFLNEGLFLESINEMYITLISKKKKLVNCIDFRHINLCSVLYQIVSKVLTNGLKKVLAPIILPNQNAFILGRLILDNIIVAYETLHTINYGLNVRKDIWLLIGYV